MTIVIISRICLTGYFYEELILSPLITTLVSEYKVVQLFHLFYQQVKLMLLETRIKQNYYELLSVTHL